MLYTISLLCILLSVAVQNAMTRTITLSFNMSLTMDEQRQNSLLSDRQAQQTHPTITAAVLRSCMKGTELSMAELSRFRLSVLSREPEVAKQESTTEQPNLNEIADANFSEEAVIDGIDYEPAADRSEESLQCFAYCLYEQLGLISKGVYMQEELFVKLYAVVGRERHLVKECLNLNTNNKCESSYKIHLCYARLKTLEAEKRLSDGPEQADPLMGEGKGREETKAAQVMNILEHADTTLEPAIELGRTIEPK